MRGPHCTRLACLAPQLAAHLATQLAAQLDAAQLAAWFVANLATELAVFLAFSGGKAPLLFSAFRFLRRGSLRGRQRPSRDQFSVRLTACFQTSSFLLRAAWSCLARAA